MSMITYSVPDISCGHCAAAITTELQTVPGVEAIEVDVKSRTVTIRGRLLDEAAIVAAIDAAGYEVAA
jgi:copper chaperone CopZ